MYCQILEIGVHSGSVNKSKLKDKVMARPRDTTTSVIMTVDLDTDPTYELTTEKAVVVVSLSALISDQMELRKSLKS